MFNSEGGVGSLESTPAKELEFNTICIFYFFYFESTPESWRNSRDGTPHLVSFTVLTPEQCRRNSDSGLWSRSRWFWKQTTLLQSRSRSNHNASRHCMSWKPFPPPLSMRMGCKSGTWILYWYLKTSYHFFSLLNPFNRCSTPPICLQSNEIYFHLQSVCHFGGAFPVFLRHSCSCHYCCIRNSDSQVCSYIF